MENGLLIIGQRGMDVKLVLKDVSDRRDLSITDFLDAFHELLLFFVNSYVLELLTELGEELVREDLDWRDTLIQVPLDHMGRRRDLNLIGKGEVVIHLLHLEDVTSRLCGLWSEWLAVNPFGRLDPVQSLVKRNLHLCRLSQPRLRRIHHRFPILMLHHLALFLRFADLRLHVCEWIQRNIDCRMVMQAHHRLSHAQFVLQVRFGADGWHVDIESELSLVIQDYVIQDALFQ